MIIVIFLFLKVIFIMYDLFSSFVMIFVNNYWSYLHNFSNDLSIIVHFVFSRLI